MLENHCSNFFGRHIDAMHDFLGMDCLKNGVKNVQIGALDSTVDEKMKNSQKRQGYICWDDYFMSVACLSAQRSKDPATQVGSCIVNEDNKIVGIGYNGMPIGCNDDELPWGRDSENPLENKYVYESMDSLPPKPLSRPDRVQVFRALYNFTASQPDEISFNEGDLLYVTDMSQLNGGWWSGQCGNQKGLIPSNYVAECAESIDFPLHEAAKRGNDAFLQECLENNVSVNGLDKSGSTPVYWASHGGHVTCLNALLCYQPDLNSCNKLGDTALHAAAWKSHTPCISALLESGASPLIKNKDGKTPLDLASDPDTAMLLKRKIGGSLTINATDYENGSGEESD